MISTSTICEETGQPIGGPEPPAYMTANSSLARAVLESWALQENPHLWVHDELRRAQAAVTRARSPRAPGYATAEAQDRLQRAVRAYKDLHWKIVRRDQAGEL